MEKLGTSPRLACREVESGPHEIRAAAALIYQSFAEYYDIFSAQREAVLRAIGAQLGEACSEVGNTRVLLDEGALVGAYSWYPAAEMAERQMISLRMLLDIDDANDDLFEQLQNYRQAVSPVMEGSHYLARIAVAENVRGLGYGQALLADFESRVQPLSLTLHVRADNHRALRFYSRAGYVPTSPPGLAYWSMAKGAPANQRAA